MFLDWNKHTQHVGSSFAKMVKNHPKMGIAYAALDEASAAESLDKKTIELISLAVAVTTQCESCISIHAKAAKNAGATESELVGALSTAIAMNAGATYTYSLRAIEAFDTQD